MNQPIVALGLTAILLSVIIMVITLGTMTPKKQVLYLSESERLGDFLPVTNLTPKSAECRKDNKRFFRNANAYTVRLGRRILTLWLGKRGTAYTFKPADTPEGKAVKIGSIYDALKTIWSEELLNKLEKNYRDPLLTSEIFVTVDLEKGLTPEGRTPVEEEDVFTESNQNMAGLVGTKVKEALQREDWIRNFGLMGIGGVIVFVCQALGLF